MSKSYGRYINLGICWGSNTEFYRDRRKQVRRKNRHIIRNLLHNFTADLFDDLFTDFRLPRKDTWNEPTDGTWKYTAKEVKKYIRKGIYTGKNGKIKK